MKGEGIWATINDEIIEKYSTFLNNGVQIAILCLAGFFFILVLAIFGAIWLFDKSIKCSIPTQYSIRFDPKGFSNNELKLYNVKSVVDGGCRLRSIQATQKGKPGILQTEKMFDPPLPKFDVLLQPWFTEIPTSSIFHIVEWNDYFEVAAECSELPGTGESVAAPVATPTAEASKTPPPSNNNVTEQQQISPNDKPPSDAEHKKNKNVEVAKSHEQEQPHHPQEKNKKNVPSSTKKPPPEPLKPVKISSSKEIIEKSSNPNPDSKKAKEADMVQPPPKQKIPTTAATASPFSATTAVPTPKNSGTPQALTPATPPKNVEALAHVAKKNS